MDARNTYQLPSTGQLPFTSVKPPAPPVNGSGQPAFKNLTKSQRAALAVAVIRGEAGLRPTLQVVAKALGVSVTYVEAAQKLPPEQLRQLRRGELTISELKHRRRRHPRRRPRWPMSWRGGSPPPRRNTPLSSAVWAWPRLAVPSRPISAEI